MTFSALQLEYLKKQFFFGFRNAISFSLILLNKYCELMYGLYDTFTFPIYFHKMFFALFESMLSRIITVKQKVFYSDNTVQFVQLKGIFILQNMTKPKTDLNIQTLVLQYFKKYTMSAGILKPNQPIFKTVSQLILMNKC